MSADDMISMAPKDRPAEQASASGAPTISVVLCTYNRAASLGVVLESLSRQRLPSGTSWELILVDNNSKDDTRAVAERFRSQGLPLEYVFEPRQGKSYALNTGIARSRGQIVAFTDDDVLVDEGWLAAYIAGFQKYDCVGAGGRIRPLWKQDPPSWFSSEGEYALKQAIVFLDFGSEAREIDKPVYGANMAFRREVFDRIGGFRTDLGPRGDVHTVGEDSDLCVRVRADGGRIFYFPDALVDHPVEPERASKAYFLHWYFYFGRMSMRKANVPAEQVRWFGVPRYLFSLATSNALRWLFTLDEKRRFYYKLSTYEYVGRILEARLLSKSSAHRDVEHGSA